MGKTRNKLEWYICVTSEETKVKKCKNNMYKAITFWGGATAKTPVSWFECSFFPHVAITIYLKPAITWACNGSVLHVATIKM